MRLAHMRHLCVVYRWAHWWCSVLLMSAQRQAVLETLAAQWILFVDADERATPALRCQVHRYTA